MPSTFTGKGDDAIVESSPLLVASEAGPTATSDGDALPETSRRDDDDTPLPKMQIALLCYARVVEPIAFFSIFPFINKMIQETGGLQEADVGFYAGLIESLFSLTQMCTMISWGRAADRLGRKPVLVFSLAGVSIATAMFGFSVHLWQMILFRCCAGVFAGTVVTVRAMISENSTPRTQARAFSWFAFTSNLGIFVGPMIGGVLSSPAEQYPAVFGGVSFFKQFPYALPTIVTGLIGVTASITSALFVKETLTVDRRASHKAAPPMSTWEILKHPGVAHVVFIYSLIMLLALAYTAVFPVFWFTDPRLGGLGFSPLQISLFLGIAGLSQALWALLVFPPLQHLIGSGGIMRLSAAVWPFMMAGWPMLNFFLRQHWDLAFWIIAPIASALGSSVAMSFTASQLALNDIAPSHATLGTLNAIALAVVAGTRAFAPVLFTSIFAVGVRTQFLWGYLVWFVFVALTLALMVALRWLPAKAEGKLKREPSGS